MKLLLFIMTFLLALPAFAISNAGIQQLLAKKGTSLETHTRKGNMIILGEVTGHAKSVPLSKVEVIITEGEAILKKEIEGTEVSGAPVVGNLQSVRFNGQYVTSQDIVGVIVAP